MRPSRSTTCVAAPASARNSAERPTAVILNVTAVAHAGSGFLTVFPCGEPQPLASNVNYLAGDVVPNAVLAKVGVGGSVCIFTMAVTVP